MNHQEQTFLQKVNDNFSQFTKGIMTSPEKSFALAATPLLGAAVAYGAVYAAGVITGNPEAVTSAYFHINNPDSSMALAALKGELPFDAANKAFQLVVGGFGSGAIAAGLAKVAQAFQSLSEETDHLKRENQLLKREFANDRALDSGDPKSSESLRSKFNKGLENVQVRSEERQQQEQATRVSSGPSQR
ncbi:hypothetical protein SJI00_21215 [Pseudomonas sp. RP23018S]|uniref:hypothetical protein n=1 Tax=Pseudomonas sp. RP23018S TaxID=3096037 RepID=UPI002ACA2394|nr:hypothetical protein [Pseudomonas sp. RP23018S]MDZ5605298.1 hypothetical protein [Pseudomonas sp. RP23018S]